MKNDANGGNKMTNREMYKLLSSLIAKIDYHRGYAKYAYDEDEDAVIAYEKADAALEMLRDDIEGALLDIVVPETEEEKDAAFRKQQEDVVRRCNEELDCLDVRIRNKEEKQPCPKCGQLCGESLVGGTYWCRTHGHFEKGERPICPKCGKRASFVTFGQDDNRVNCPACGLISPMNNTGAKKGEYTKALTEEQYHKIQNEIDGDFHRSGPSYLLSILGKHYELGVKNDGAEYLIRERKTYYDEPETIASFAGFDEMFSFLVKLNNGTKREPPSDDKDADKKNPFGSDEEKLPCPECGQLCSYNSIHELYWCRTHGYFSKNDRPICPECGKLASFTTFDQDDVRGYCPDCGFIFNLSANGIGPEGNR